MTAKKRSEAKYTTPDEARAAVQRLKDEQVAATVDLSQRRATLAEIEAHVGDRLLDARIAKDDAAAAKINADLAAARLAAETAGTVSAAIERRIKAANRDVLLADANALRVEAGRLWKELAPRLAESNAMLDALAEREGTRWLPFPVVDPSGVLRNGSWSQTNCGAELAKIADAERAASHLERIAGVAPGTSCLPVDADGNYIPLHVGNPGVVILLVQGPSAPSGFAGAVKAELDAKGVRGNVRG
jgi:hypothetical protein